ncbi:metallophosphoesterase [Roseisalinus antarcticus]|uniref:Alkaline phosphatase n=1 Tax=Roseisalinus antarcticus TaxID=254357 RepID=A0A1Y5TNC0_9RHOB|nr:metallophosphoesterase [Roseisalinus antarcticus]SLN64408.1 Alkaline phosphatase precursor [Roseisalinus antarcticus]
MITIDTFSLDTGVIGDGITFGPTIALQGSSDPGAIVGIYLDDIFLGETQAGPDGSWSYSAGDFEEGTYAFVASIDDGVTLQSTAPFGITVDLTAPGVVVDPVATDGIVDGTEDGAVVFSGTVSGVEDGQVVTLAVRDAGGAVVWTGSAVVASGVWASAPADLGALPDGAGYELTADVTDAAGNSAPQAGASFRTTSAPPPEIVTFETRIASGLDDVEQRADGSIYLDSSDLELGQDGSRAQTVGLRFGAIDVPQGAVITNAYIQFQVDEVSGGFASLLIRAEASDDAAAWGSGAGSVSGRALTGSSVAWLPEDWTSVGEAGAAQRTPNLAALVQDVVAREGWSALSDMAFVVTGTGERIAESHEGRASAAPLLHIEYTMGGSGAPVAFDAVADTDPGLNELTLDAAAGTPVGITASASDATPGDEVRYSVEDARFEIDPVTGVVTRSDSGTLSFGPDGMLALTVTATSSDGSLDTRTFQIALDDGLFGIAIDPVATDGIVDGTEDGAVVFSGTVSGVEDGQVVTLAVRDAGGAVVWTGSAVVASGVWASAPADLGALPDGAGYELTADVTDAAGNSAPQAGASFRTTSAPPPEIVTFETRIASGLDDVEQRADGSIYLDSSDLELGQDGSRAQTVGLRFGAIDVPQGAVITNAYIQFQVDEVSGGFASLLIRAEASDDAAAWGSGAGSVSGRALTGSSVAWLPEDWTSVGEAGAAQRTPNLAALVQDVVAREGWSALSDMAFVVTGTGERIAESHEGRASAAPLLHIEYTMGGAYLGTDPVTTDSVLDDAEDNAVVLSGTAAGIEDGQVVALAILDAGGTSVWTGSAAVAGGAWSTGPVNLEALPDGAEYRLTANVTDAAGTPAPQAVTTFDTVHFRFAVFGDYGTAKASGERAVAALVDTWDPEFILTVGDNNYFGLSYEEAVGQHYADYIGNYQGSYGDGSEINRFFPAIGNHEYTDGPVEEYFDYFTLPDNERYYDFQIGSIHFFNLNSNIQEPDGRSSTSAQAEWFYEAIAQSTATFNVVYFHHAPYEQKDPGETAMRWDFEDAGVDLVFSGHDHDYYRIARDDNGDGKELTYVVTGLGGFDDDLGANAVSVTDDGLLVEFYDETGLLIDSFSVDAPEGVTPQSFDGNDVLTGGADADYLWGVAGNDTLTGNAGDDMLIGGEDADLFIFRPGDGVDIVADFEAGAAGGDVLDLSAYGIFDVAGFGAVASAVGGDLLASFADGSKIVLLGRALGDFVDDDFWSGAIG